MTLGCGAAAGNITRDNVGPQHLINIKRLAYVVRKPEEAFEMPLDINAAPAGAELFAGARRSHRPGHRGGSRGAVSGFPRHSPYRLPRRRRAGAGRSFVLLRRRRKAVVPNVAADVVDRFLARRESSGTSGGYS